MSLFFPPLPHQGGYGAVAIAEALESYGANIVKLQAAGGPYKLSSAMITVAYKDVVNGDFPEGLRFYSKFIFIFLVP